MFNNYNELAEYVSINDIKMIDFKVVTLTGKWNHLTIPASRLSQKIFEEGIGFDGSSYGYAVIEKSDMIFKPDIKTAFLDPYCEIPTISMIANIYQIGDEVVRFQGDPRYIAEKAENHLKNLKIADEFIIGPEFEFYVFDHISYEVEHNHQEVTIDSIEAPWNTNDKEYNQGYKTPLQKGYHAALPYDITNDLRAEMCLRLEEMGVPVKYHHHEVGAAGQLEIEVELGSMLKMADSTLIAKYVIKNTAITHGKTATFMPKPIYNEAGSGMHVHMLLKKDGKNIFYDENGYSGLSENAMYFIGGILKHAPSLLAFTNPSTNSYKRLVPGFEAPVSICFATSNRSSVIRVPGYAKNPEKKRFEFRSSDGTCNPYMAYSALLMAGIDGIVNKIDPVKEGFGPYDVNVFDLPAEEREKIKALPKSLEESLEALKNDYEYLLAGEVFTKSFIENWINYKYNKEVMKVIPVPTPQEYSLYFDI
ncbi:glutamine synthetase [Fervidicella metallireducens AeB]|uniref:Glutamine synthetase n=1 Tax=Fervidicella metallireducens AeB TaxID=1403537 RepID=A0A017RZV4_9CLOT|nr:type I glutamate--ammonia ligase [Fervidicella metallireducens]EYE89460.1 glutamine synthetase [Fervidicella metallireducens AeB]